MNDAVSTTELLLETVAQDPGARLLSIPDSFGGWFDLTAAEFHSRVRDLAKGFLASGLSLGDRVGVLCSNRFESTLVDCAAAMIGVAVVPLRAEATPAELMRVLDDAAVTAVVVETALDFARFDELHSDLPLIADVWQVALGDLDKRATAGRVIDDAELDARAADVVASTPATLSYWNTPDGSPRRSLITQGDLVARVQALAAALEGATGADASTLQILPSTDIHARVVTLLALATGTRLGHLADHAALVPTLASFRATLLIARPATFDEIAEIAAAKAQTSGRGPAFRQAIEVAVDYETARAEGSVPRGLRTRHALAEALVYRGLRKTLGGRLRFAVSIAETASLESRIRQIMSSLDVHALEGYGTVETTGLVTLERPSDPVERPTGSVGAPLGDVEVTIGEDGRVLIRGTGVRAATDVSEGSDAHATSPEPDWVRTDEFGAIDDAGRLILADRELASTAQPAATWDHDLSDEAGSSATAEL